MPSIPIAPADRRSAVSDAILAIVAERGIDQASVREVAARANVSIGTVQHYFPTKDSMLADAYASAVESIRTRLSDLEFGEDVHRNLTLVVEELLPLDDRRTFEVRVHLAFAAKAATDASLRAIETELLTSVHAELATALARAWTGARSKRRCLVTARVIIALADGLAMHGVSTDGVLSAKDYTNAVSLALGALLAD